MTASRAASPHDDHPNRNTADVGVSFEPPSDEVVGRNVAALDAMLDGNEDDAREQGETFEFLRWGLARDYLREAYDAGLGEHLTALGPATDEEIRRSRELLDSLLEGDEEEQRETGAYVARALVERRSDIGEAR